MRAFITATGTGAGKTVVSRALALALGRRPGARVVALKPIETGCAPEPADARALASACGRPELADAPGLYRARRPVAPYAATLAGEPPPPPLEALANAVRAASAGARDVLVEGAGGPLVPYDREHDVLDLALALDLPLVLVAPDALGVLSHALAAVHSVVARGGEVRAIALNRTAGTADPSTESNLRILQERLPTIPICPFAPADLGTDALVRAVNESRLLELWSPDTNRT